jgi:tetratricopeptide (TPR) repeat protein
LYDLQYPWMLFAWLALPVLLLLLWYLRSWKKKTAKIIGDPHLVKELTQDFSEKKFNTKFLLAMIALALLVLAAAGVRKTDASATVKRNGIDVMIALDVSKSMLAADVQPNRLDRAKQLISKLIDGLKNDRVGLVVFAGKAYLQMPLTADHAAAKLFLSAVSTDMVATQGTILSDALAMCNLAFNSPQKKYKSIVLISDGEDHDTEALKVAQNMAAEGIMINTVGIGSSAGSTITDPLSGETKKDATGGPVITRLNEALLQQMATAGNGNYQIFTNTNETAKNILTQLAKLEKRPVTDVLNAVYQHYFQWPALIALVLLILSLLMSERQNNHRTKGVIAALLLLLTSASRLQAQDAETQIAKGNIAYKKGNYKTAIAAFEQATANNKNAKAWFNLGNALYKDKQLQKAVAAFEQAAATTALPLQQAKAYYNKGVVLQNNKQLAECIAAYKQALRLNPNDEDARFNLQKALQQQQKQKPKNDNKNNPKPQQQNKQQPKPQPSKMNQQEALEKLKALLEQEKMLQDKLRKNTDASPNKPEKDW